MGEHSPKSGVEQKTPVTKGGDLVPMTVIPKVNRAASAYETRITGGEDRGLFAGRTQGGDGTPEDP